MRKRYQHRATRVGDSGAREQIGALDAGISAHPRVGFHKAFLVLRIVWADMKLEANFGAGFEKPWTHPSVVAVVLPVILWAADGAGSD